LAVHIDPEFAQYMRDFTKKYKAEEVPQRMQAFHDSKIRIEKQNAMARTSGSDTTFAINKFSDLSPDDFKDIYLSGYKRNPHRPLAQRVFIPDDYVLKSTYDWRDQGVVTPVKNQGQCGSCWAFSTTEGVESAWAMTKQQLIELSPQQIVDCDTSDQGCNGGDLPTAFSYVQSAGGLELDQNYPYQAADGTCQFNQSMVAASISSFTPLDNSAESDMVAASQQYGPLSVCVDASNWQSYSGGIFTECGQSIDHCVQIVGWDTDVNPPYWIVRNSWGTDWGESGFIRVYYGNDTCGIAQDNGYATC